MLEYVKKLLSKIGVAQQKSPVVIDNSFYFKQGFWQEDFDRFVFDWNVKFPLDRWYRVKYGIRFNSKEHREVSFLDILFEYNEKQLYDRINKKEDYTPNKGEFLKKKKRMEKRLTMDEVKREFEQIDLSKYDD